MANITRIYYNKLVRDNIPDIIRAKRQECGIRTVTDIQEYQQELFKKIEEEGKSLSMVRTKEEFLEECSDLLMVLDSIIEQLGITGEELREARKENRMRKGAYKKQQFLQWSADVDYETDETPQGIPL